MEINYDNTRVREIFNLLFIFFADAVIWCIALYILLIKFDMLAPISNKSITILSVIAVALLIYVFFKKEKHHGLSAALFMYLIFTQFGMSTIYYLFGPEYLSSFSSTTLSFLESYMYEDALILGILASIGYVYGARLASKLKLNYKTENFIENPKENKLVYYTGIFFLLVTLCYFFLFFITGRINFGMSYYSYLSSGVINPAYSWILLIYSLGLCFTVSVSHKTNLRLSLFLFGLPAMLLFSTGNRGEVLYATLAALGIVYYRNKKIKLKYILFVIGLVFVIIPFIRNARHIGTLTAFDLITVDAFDALAEMGHQLRLSVLILEEFDRGLRDFLHGFSYINPIINIFDDIIPWPIRLDAPKDFNFETAFSGLGFSQVAESYANFGTFGVIVYHSIIAFIMRRFERSHLKGARLAYCGGILVILINATRNRFAFVFGQLLILTVVFQIIKLFSKKRTDMRKGKYNG